MEVGDGGSDEVRGTVGIAPRGVSAIPFESCEKREGELMTWLALLATGDGTETPRLMGVVGGGSIPDGRRRGGGARAQAPLTRGVGEEGDMDGVD